MGKKLSYAEQAAKAAAQNYRDRAAAEARKTNPDVGKVRRLLGKVDAEVRKANKAATDGRTYNGQHPRSAANLLKGQPAGQPRSEAGKAASRAAGAKAAPVHVNRAMIKMPNGKRITLDEYQRLYGHKP